MGFHDTTSDDDGAHFLEPPMLISMAGTALSQLTMNMPPSNPLGVRLRLHQIDDGFTVGEGVIDAVVSLCDTVAQIGGKIAGGLCRRAR